MTYLLTLFGGFGQKLKKIERNCKQKHFYQLLTNQRKRIFDMNEFYSSL